MSRAIFEKPLSDLTWADLEYIVTQGLEEDQTLEFKETLPAKDENGDPWQSGKNKIGDYARDALAAEIVAFANAYGGVLIVGIVDAKDNPGRAKSFNRQLVRNCVECVERLGAALRSRIDPPISGFDIRAVLRPDGDGDGLIIIRVASSSMAPHGVGRPPEAYVRRGSSAEPLTMRDLHNLFWESRTRRERILQIQDERQQSLLDLEKKKLDGRLIRASDQKPVPASMPHLMFRITAIPEQSLSLNGLAFKLSSSPLALPYLRTKQGNPVDSILGWGHLSLGWLPRAHGARAEIAMPRAFGFWMLSDDGIVEASGLSLNEDNEHWPDEFSALSAQLLLISERMRLWSGRPDIPIVFDAQFHHDGTARGVAGRTSKMAGLDERITIGPFTATNRSQFPQVHQELEREIWAGLGFSKFPKSEIDFDSAFQDYLSV